MAPHFDIEQQLQRHGFALRRLAAELLRDPADVDDAMQETWLRAMRWPPRDTNGVGRWLGTVLRNVVRRSRRRDALRERREAAVFRADFVEDHAVVAAREDTGRRLFAAMETLDLATRDVVWRRFFEGQAPREIAATRNEPVATVKSRLQRGIRNLREQLGKDGGNEWRAAFAVAFGFGKQGVATAALAGGVTMAVSTKVAGTVVVAAIVLAVWWPRESMEVAVGRDAEVPPTVAANAARLAGTAEVQTSAREPAVVASVTAPPPAVATARRRGRVVDFDTKQPLAGVTVAIGDTMSVKPAANDLAVVTGADGRFDLECAPERQSRLWFSHRERLSAWLDGSPLLAGEHDDVVDVRMRRGRSLTGRLVTSEGAPLAKGVVVEARFAADHTIVSQSGSCQALVEDGGRFSLPPVAFGDVEILLPASDHELLDVRVRVTEHEPGELQLVATPRPFVAGHVVDSEGAPIAGVGVCLYPSGRRVVTDAAGAFRLVQQYGKNLPANVAIHDALDFAPPEGRSHSEMVECAPNVPWGTTDLRIVLQRAPRLPIEVVDDTGTPVEEFGVVLQRTALGASGRTAVRQRGRHENGRLDVERVVVGRTGLRVVPVDPHLSPSGVLEVTTLAPLRVVLPRRLPCAVEVVKRGRPVAGVFVDLVLSAEAKPLPFGILDTKRPSLIDPHTGNDAWLPGESRRESIAGGRTDADGLVRLWRDEASADRELLVQSEGHAPAAFREPVFPADGSPLRVQLPELGHVEGRVHLRGRSHRDVGVWLVRGEQKVAVRVRGDGAFRSHPIAAGSWRAELRTKGSVLGSERDVEITDGATTAIDWDFTAFPTASLHGRFVREGAAITGLVVDVSRIGVSAHPERIASVEIGPDGRFAADDLLAGTYRLIVRSTAGAAGPPWVDATRIELGAGEHRAVEIAFPPRRLVVHLRRTDGTEVRGERIVTRCDGVQWPAIFGTPVDERVVIDPAPALPLEFRLAASPTWSPPVQFPAGLAEAEVTVVLPDPPK